MDDRETRGSRRYDLELIDFGHEVIVQRQETDIEVPEFSIGVERKTISDFKNSVFNGSIFNEVRELGGKYLRAYLAIEGNAQYLDPTWLFGTTCAIEQDYFVYTVMVFDSLPIWLNARIKKFLRPSGVRVDPIRSKYISKEATPQEKMNHVLMALPGIGQVKVESVQGLKLIPAIRGLSNKVKPDFREWLE
jgi:ERCC4-type nuclease